MGHKIATEATLRIVCDEQKAFGPGLAQLLEGIELHGSLRRSAAAMGMSYNKAWNIVRHSEQCWGVDLIERRIGGVRGGGAVLTSAGHDLLCRYRAFERAGQQALEQLVHAHFEGM